jgi:hypothetical protein
MSKNLTRKGLAFGAVVALGTTLFAGAPAQAASVLFAPTTGTGNTLVAGETFSLTASLSSDLPASNSTQLKFKVANTTGVAATVKLNNTLLLAVQAGGADTHAAGASVVALDSSVGGATAASALSSSTTSAVYGLGSAVAADAAVTAGSSQATNPTTISIASTAATTASYTVTAFLDANNNAVIDNGELSAVQTVNFVKAADAGAVVTFSKPVLSSTQLKATVAFNSDINLAQSTVLAYKVGFGIYGSAGKKTATGEAAEAVADTNATTASYTAADGNFLTATATAVNSATAIAASPIAGATYSAQAYIGSTAVGSEVLQVVGSDVADANGLTVAPTISDNVRGTVGNAYSVRTGVTNTAVKTTVKLTPAGGTATAVGAGVAVKVTVSGLTLGTNSGATITDTLSVAGAAVTAANAATFSATVYTAADGTVTVPVVAGYGYATTAITVALRVIDAASIATGSASLTWTAPAAPTFTRVAVGSTDLTVVKGGNVNLQYALKDNYNALYSGTDYRLVVSAAGAGTSPTTTGFYVPVVNGLANISFADNSTAAGTNVLTITKEVLANGIWGSSTAVATVNVNVLASAQTASTVTAAVNSATAKGSASDRLLPLDVAGTYVSGNTAIAYNTVTAPSITSGSDTTISGVVTDAAGVAVANASVTVQLAGAQISSGTAYGIGSLTVLADNSGAYSVTVSTHTAGAQTATVTSGAATKTVKVYVAAAGVATGKTLTITAPATAQSGTSVSYSVVLTDKYGNPIAVAATGVTPTFSFSATGVGSSTAAVTSTTAAGYASGSTTTQPLDAGNLVVTATYNFDGATASAPVTATATIVVSDLAKAAADKAAAEKAAAEKAAADAKAAAELAAKAKTVTVTAGSSTSQTGRAVDVSVKVVNNAGTAGAGRTVTFTSSGAGSLTGYSAVTDANGVATVKLLAGAADNGDAVVTASVDGVVASSSTVTFGTTDSQIDIVNNRVTAVASFSKGKTVALYVDGIKVWSKLSTSDADVVLNYNLKKGAHTVTVKISGGFTTTEKFIVK